MVEIRPLTEELRPSFERLLRDFWMQTWDDDLGHAIVRWRYYERPDGETWVVTDHGSCVGLLDSMLRAYMLDGQRIVVRETCDWYCHPNYRVGHGLNLLLRAKRQKQPILVINGTEHTQGILPKFGFQLLPGRLYIRPLTLRGLAGNLLRRRWWRQERLAQIVPSLACRSVQLHRPANGRVSLIADDTNMIPPPTGDGLLQMIEPWHWQWLLKMPRAMAQPIGMMFFLDDEPVGCSISQLEPTAADYDGRILHFQFTDPVIGRWVLSTTVNFLRDCGVGFLRCCASTPTKFKLLDDAGFHHSRNVPVMLFSKEYRPLLVDAGYLRGDDAMPFQALRGRRLAERYA